MKKDYKIQIATILIFISIYSNFGYLNLFISEITDNWNMKNNENILESEELFSIKNSGYWNLTGNPIWIDELNPTKDWAYTASNNEWCYGSGTWSDPYIIENVIIDGQNSDNCILIEFSSVYFIIRNSTFVNSDRGSLPYYNSGIKLHDVENGRIINNNISRNKGTGITLRALSNNNTISGNLIQDTRNQGIYLHNTSGNNTISGNIIQNSSNGIEIRDRSNFNMIKENKVKDSRGKGIKISISSEFNTITMNKVSNNFDSGIYIFSENNSIYENFVVREGILYVSNVGSTNNWNNSRIGNYYGDYKGEDNDKNGIGDISYAIATGVVDWLPIVDNDAPNITINSPLSNEVFEELIPVFNVMITDRYLDEMWYTLNESTTKHYFTENGSIDQAAWGNLPNGSVTIKFYGIDLPENIGIKEVVVRKGPPIIPSIIPSISSYNIGIITSLMLIISLVAIIILKKKTIQ